MLGAVTVTGGSTRVGTVTVDSVVVTVLKEVLEEVLVLVVVVVDAVVAREPEVVADVASVFVDR